MFVLVPRLVMIVVLLVALLVLALARCGKATPDATIEVAFHCGLRFCAFMATPAQPRSCFLAHTSFRALLLLAPGGGGSRGDEAALLDAGEALPRFTGLREHAGGVE